MTISSEYLMPDFTNTRTKTSWITALGTLYQIGLDLSRIDFLAVGENENYSGEIRKQSPAPGERLTETTQIVLEVGVSSAVDFMPYQFFYGLNSGSERSAGWEDRSRKLMAPFDAANICREAIIRQQGVRYSFGTSEPDYVSDFLGLFDLSLYGRNWLESERSLWSVLMPSYHLWSGNPEAVALVLKLHFGYDFEIVESVADSFPIPVHLQNRLGSTTAVLGHDLLVGSSFVESDSSYEILVKEVRTADIASLLPGGELRQKLAYVLSICMPSNLDYKIILQARARETRLGDIDQTAILGYTTGL